MNITNGILLFVGITAPLADPPEWGGFRGNDGTGIALGTNLPASLDPAESVVWRTEVPPGYSSPIVAGDNVFVTAATAEELQTICLDRRTGAVRWVRAAEYDGVPPGRGSSAAPTPVTDGERIYVMFHHVGLIAYDGEGTEVWRRALGPFHIPHGMAASPVIHDDTVIQLVDQDVGSYLIALDSANGKTRWRTERPTARHGYATPAIYAPREGDAQVIVSGSSEIVGYSVSDGEKAWWVRGAGYEVKHVPLVIGSDCFVSATAKPQTRILASGPWSDFLAERDQDGDGLVSRVEWPELDQEEDAFSTMDLDDDELIDEKDYEYIVATARDEGGLFAIRLGGRGDVTESHVLWKQCGHAGALGIATPIVYANALLAIKHGGIVTAFDLSTGEVARRKRIGVSDNFFASPVAAAGKLLVVSRSGVLVVLSGDERLATLSISDLEEETWSTPAIVDECVFVRSQEAVWCLGIPSPK